MSGFSLKPHPRFAGRKGPLVLAVLDGIGIGKGDEADAVRVAATPTIDRLWAPGVRCALRAHGRSVGLPGDDDMGNSEVGHNALGCGRIYDQGALRVRRAIASGEMFEGDMWCALIDRCSGDGGGALHFLGLLSDGNVHSHIDHLIAMLRHAAEAGVQELYVHALLDGRDVEARSALRYLEQLEAVLAELRPGGRDAAIASGGGRMGVTMDRYEADWDIVARGWAAHVHGDARRFPTAAQAVRTFYDEDTRRGDQDLPAFVIERDGQPLAPIRAGDAVVCFNFRGDRVIEISRAFEEGDEFSAFDRGRRPEVLYVGMMEYDGDTHVPRRFLVQPPDIKRTMGEYLARNQVSQLAISETQKYGHVTYFWNGNRSGMFDSGSETYIEVASDKVPFEQRPWMKAAEITDRLIGELRTGAHRFARVNYANGDMVGHTGNFDATVLAVEAVDLQLARLVRAIEQLEGILVITADHGNADEMFQYGKDGMVARDPGGQPVAKTSHTLNRVPFAIYDPGRSDEYQIDESVAQGAGIANVTATTLELLGLAPPDDVVPSLIRFK